MVRGGGGQVVVLLLLQSPVMRLVLAARVLVLVVLAVGGVVHGMVLMVVGRWSANLIIARVLIRGRLGLAATAALLHLVHVDESTDRRTRRDGGLAEEPLVLLELAVALVRLRVGHLVRGEVPVPAPDYVAVQLRVLEVGSFEGVDLSLQIGQGLLECEVCLKYDY